MRWLGRNFLRVTACNGRGKRRRNHISFTYLFIFLISNQYVPPLVLGVPLRAWLTPNHTLTEMRRVGALSTTKGARLGETGVVSLELQAGTRKRGVARFRCWWIDKLGELLGLFTIFANFAGSIILLCFTVFNFCFRYPTYLLHKLISQHNILCV